MTNRKGFPIIRTPEQALAHKTYLNSMKYYLMSEPKYPGTLLAGAFDAIDQVYGTEPFTKQHAIEAITTVMAISPSSAESKFNALVEGEHLQMESAVDNY